MSITLTSPKTNKTRFIGSLKEDKEQHVKTTNKSNNETGINLLFYHGDQPPC